MKKTTENTTVATATIELKEKMTKKDWFTILSQVVSEASLDDEVRTGLNKFMTHEVELLNKKHSTSKKVSEENKSLMTTIQESFSEEDSLTVTEWMENHSDVKREDGKALSNQKVSALFKKLCESGILEKTVEKGVSRFSLAK